MSTTFGFGRERRIRSRRDFLRVQAKTPRIATPHFVLLLAPHPESVTAPSRLGIVVTRKIGNAVARNRIKRVCRECFRQNPALLPPGMELVVIARQAAENLTAAEVRAEWARAGERLKRRALEVLAQRASEAHVSRALRGGASE